MTLPLRLSQWSLMVGAASQKHNLDPNLILAVIETESAGNPWAVRYEPMYHYTIVPRDWASRLATTADTETMLQMTSMGLMQVMGGKCRELGFEDNLARMFIPENSIEYGCLVLKQKQEKYGSDESTIYAAYNAGSVQYTVGQMFINQRNVDRFYKNFILIRDGQLA